MLPLNNVPRGVHGLKDQNAQPRTETRFSSTTRIADQPGGAATPESSRRQSYRTRQQRPPYAGDSLERYGVPSDRRSHGRSPDVFVPPHATVPRPARRSRYNDDVPETEARTSSHSPGTQITEPPAVAPTLTPAHGSRDDRSVSPLDDHKRDNDDRGLLPMPSP